jgi:tetratricopeptide (TPR) repeat protein
MVKILLALCLIYSAAQAQSDTAARFNRAVELQRQGALREAAAEYRALLEANPNYVEALANLGSVLSRLGQHEEAVAAYERALQLRPGLTPLLLNLAIAHHRASRFDRAVDAFERVLAAAPDLLQARQLLGISLVELGRDAEAVTHLEKTLSSSATDPAVLYSLGLAYLRLGRPELRGAIAHLGELPTGAAAARLLAGQALLAGHEYEKAIAELEQAAKLNSGLPRLQYSIGLALLKLGRNKEAIAAFEDELARVPRDFSTLFYLAYLHEADNDLTGALGLLEQALKLEPQSPEANGLLGKILLKQNRPADALAPLETAVKKDPGDPEKRYQLARAYQQLGRREDAAREFAEVQRL